MYRNCRKIYLFIYLDTASVADPDPNPDPDSPDPRVFGPPYLWLMDPDPSIIRQK